MAAPAGRSAARVKHHDAAAGVGRIGLLGHGVVHVLLGILAVLLAFGSSQGETDQRGALQQLARHNGGWLVLLLIAIGLTAYALWLLMQTLTGPVGAEDKPQKRVACGLRGAVYGGLSVSAWKIVIDGRTSSQARSQEALTARVMRHDGGRWLVGVVGLVVVGVGAYLAYRAFVTKFEKQLDLATASPGVRHAVVFLGKWGGVARGVVVGLAGVLVVVAAVQFDPKKARGVDGALRALRDTGGGPWLLVIVAIGLIMFGLFGVAEARFRRV